MRIVDIRVMRGPNYWSVRRNKLVVMKLDLEELEEQPTNKIEGFYDRLTEMFPTMYEHRCSKGCAGGFFMRVQEGTWMGHVIEHIALEIQTLAGMDCGFGRTRGTGDYGVYNVVFVYEEEECGVYAAKSAVRIAEALIANEAIDLEEEIVNLRKIRERERLGPSTGALVEEAQSRGIPWIRLNKYSLVQLGYGKNQKRIQATITGQTNHIAVEIACDKEDTKELLGNMGIPIPTGKIIRYEDDLQWAIDRIGGYPIVTKPIDGNHGRGATTDIRNYEDAVKGYEAAKEHSRSIIVERFISGLDHRLLVVDHQFVAASKRTPAAVTGDGKMTIQELIDEVNKDERRGMGHEKVLTTISVDKATKEVLKGLDYGLDTVLKDGEELWLKPTANLSTGGTAEDVTEIVHPFNVFMAERISKIVGLDICGIDIMTEDISVPLDENGGAVIEVNAAPGFRMHLAPTSGLPRNVAAPVIDMLYPPNSTARIPIVAVTGTNGKTTTTRLAAHLFKSAGHKVGFTTSDGVYIENRLLNAGDCTGPASAEFVLRDPTVDFAVLECARGGLLRSGLGFHKCDIAIVTNVAADHLGLRDINTLEQLAKAKGVIPETVLPGGYAILNADDDLVYQMHQNLRCNVVYFSLDEHNPRIKRHCENGGVSAVAENGYITIFKGTWKLRVTKIATIPITFGGRANFMIQNVLPVALAGYVRGMKLHDIRIALETFIPSPTTTPGRMNMFKFPNCEVIVDFAHNPAGLRAVGDFLANYEAPEKVGIVSTAGDRRDEDLIELGEVAAEIFDSIVIREDRDLRGREYGEVAKFIEKGVAASATPYTMILNQEEAIVHAVNNVKDGGVVTICSDKVSSTIEFVRKLQEERQSFSPVS